MQNFTIDCFPSYRIPCREYQAPALWYRRGYLQIPGMPDWGRIFCQLRRFGTGILTDFKPKQRGMAEKDAPRRDFSRLETPYREGLQNIIMHKGHGLCASEGPLGCTSLLLTDRANILSFPAYKKFPAYKNIQMLIKIRRYHPCLIKKRRSFCQIPNFSLAALSWFFSCQSLRW